jgi:hypothetical protein
MEISDFRKTFFLLILILAINNCQEKSRIENEYITEEEISFYKDVIPQFYNGEHKLENTENKIIAYYDSTFEMYVFEDYATEESLKESIEYWHKYEKIPKKDMFIIDSLIKKSKEIKRVKLDSLQDDSIKTLLFKRNSVRNKKEDGAIRLSRVAFNENKTQAAAYILWHCGSLCGSTFFILCKKKAGKWIISYSITTGVS